METPHSTNPGAAGGLEEDDDTARAYEAIAQQLNQWTSPRVSGNNNWTNISGSFIGGDDDDGLVIKNPKASTPGGSSSKGYTPSSYKYESNVMDWWNRDLIDPAPRDGDDDDDDEITTSSSKLRVTRTTASSSTPKKTPTVERASTPVMSNSSKKKPTSKYGSTSISKGSSLLRNLEETEDDNDGISGDDAMDEEDEMLPVNVQSPWFQQQKDERSSTSKRPPQSPGMGSTYTSQTPRAISPFRNEKYEYRCYHNTLLEYLKARRSLSDRIDINRDEQALTLANPNDDTLALQASYAADINLVQEEIREELLFMKALKISCWERETSSRNSGQPQDARLEGNFWALLHDLRGLGTAALLWADDNASVRQNSQATASFLESSATRIHSTPKELVDELSGGEAPLVLKRRKKILEWVEHCLYQLVSQDTRTAVSMAASKTTNFSSLSLMGEQNLDKVLQSCFELILAGRLNDARMLLRKAGQPLMAAKFGGGAPAGVENIINENTRTSEPTKVGNVNRPLWKQQMWKLSSKMHKNSSEASRVEAAIHSILADDYKAAMENPTLRSWEKGLYVVLHAMWGRCEDELLHLHNNHRRRARPPFPGTQYKSSERAQLQMTCQLSNMTERGVIELLAASPFDDIKGLGHQCRAIAALLIGRMTLMDFLAEETEAITNPGDETERRVERLRFLTHLLLYLDSLSACTTPVILEGVHELKNSALFAYVDHLASHEELWEFLVLYASLLPEEVLVEYFPPALVYVEGEEQRRLMIENARELFSRDGLDLVILRIVVRLILEEEEQDDMDTDDSSSNVQTTPTRSDIRKMKAIQWLCFFEEHTGDALIAANMLLRQFLLRSKFASAIMFLHDFLPPEVIEGAMTSNVTPNNDDTMESVTENERYQALVAIARTEHVALQSYLKALRAVEEWELVIKTPLTHLVVDDKLETSALNEQEQAVARSMERRELIRQKRKVSRGVVAAAETARTDIMNVLLHEGGWLADSEADTGFKDDTKEGMQRKDEIKALRSRLLPNAVELLHMVCSETAAWMWKSLLQSLPELGSTPKEVLEALDDGTSPVLDSGDENPMSPLSPKFWTSKALSVAESVASDEFLILDAFGAAELKEMLAKMSDIAVNDLMYSA